MSNPCVPIILNPLEIGDFSRRVFKVLRRDELTCMAWLVLTLSFSSELEVEIVTSRKI